MFLFDSHTHIDFDDFDQDRDEVLTRAKKAGVNKLIISATTQTGWINIQTIVNEAKSEWPSCYAAYGLHPMFMQEHKTADLHALSEQLKQNKVVAIGEIGLDFFIPVYEDDKQAQIKLFVEQLKMADAFNLPVIIHARKSLDIVLKHLRKFPNIKGSIHSFSGSLQQADQLLDLGFYLSFGGPVTFDRANKLRQIVSTMPLNKLLIETDSPDQSDSLHQGERNEPAYLFDIAKSIAELRNVTIEELAKATTINAETLFKL